MGPLSLALLPGLSPYTMRKEVLSRLIKGDKESPHATADCGSPSRPRPQSSWVVFFFFFSTSIYSDSSRAREPLDFSVDLSQEIIWQLGLSPARGKENEPLIGAALQGSGSQGWGRCRQRRQGGGKEGGSVACYPVPAHPRKTWGPHARGRLKHRLPESNWRSNS